MPWKNSHVPFGCFVFNMTWRGFHANRGRCLAIHWHRNHRDSLILSKNWSLRSNKWKGKKSASELCEATKMCSANKYLISPPLLWAHIICMTCSNRLLFNFIFELKVSILGRYCSFFLCNSFGLVVLLNSLDSRTWGKCVNVLLKPSSEK